MWEEFGTSGLRLYSPCSVGYILSCIHTYLIYGDCGRVNMCLPGRVCHVSHITYTQPAMQISTYMKLNMYYLSKENINK